MLRHLNNPIFPRDVVTARGMPQVWLNAQQRPAVSRTDRIPVTTALVDPWSPQRTREQYEQRSAAVPGGPGRYTRRMESVVIEDPTVDLPEVHLGEGPDDVGYASNGLAAARTHVEHVHRGITETGPSEERHDDLVSPGRCSVVARSGNEDPDALADDFGEVGMGDVASAPAPQPISWGKIAVCGALALGLFYWLRRQG